MHTFVVQLLKAVEAVTAVTHHFASLTDIAELLGQFQQTDLGSDDLLFLGHCPVSVSGAGGRVAVPVRGENRARPRHPLRKPTTIVRLSSSYRTTSISFTRLSSASSSAANPRSASRASAGTFVVSSPNSTAIRSATRAMP